MALRVTEGIPIVFPVTNPGLAFRDAFDRAAGSANLPIPRKEQQAAAWCYAACAEMVINYCHSAVVTNQCQVVSFVKRGKDQLNFCCDTDKIDCIVAGCKAKDIGLIFDLWQVGHDTTGVPGSPEFGQVQLNKLKEEIDAKRPVEAVVDWKNGGSHAVLVVGIKNDWLFIVDPLEHDPYGGWQTIGSLQAGFSGGKWSLTWTGLRRI